MNLPFHRYFGPGNSDDEGEPTNYNDYIAKEHDKAYGKAKNKKEIFNADKKSSNDFLTNIFSTNFDISQSIPAFIGYSGLKIKNKVEEFIDDTIYPNFR